MVVRSRDSVKHQASVVLGIEVTHNSVLILH